jgi:hypothetical protein
VKLSARDEDMLERYEQLLAAVDDAVGSIARANAVMDLFKEKPLSRAQVRRAQARKALAERLPAATVSRTQEWRLRKKMERRGGLSHPTGV